MKRTLFITNGHGEDLVAAEIIKRLDKKAEIVALPFVGDGSVFDSLNINVIGPRKIMPSGGFSFRNLSYLAKDIFAGLIGNTLEKMRALRELRGSFDLTVAIGDIVPIIGALRVKAPFIFVGVNKSSYYKRFGYSYTPWEKLLLQRHALKVFVRDKLTQEDITSRGIKVKTAEYAGNPLMDCFKRIQIKEPKDPRTKVIGFLPGTRSDAYLNIEDFEKVVEEIIKLKNSDYGLKFIIATKLSNIPQYFEKLPFSQVLAESDLIIGLSGTGNEQAAGFGVPLISFYGRGSQYNKSFAEAQKQLLGDALSLVRDDEPILIAAELWQLLRHPDKLKQMGKFGKERMGEPGAVDKIAKALELM